MLAITRYRVDPAEADGFVVEATQVLRLLAGRPGWRRGRVGRAVDDPVLWVVTTEWDGVGAYRRALSSYDVKIGATAFLGRGIDEPGAYELLVEQDDP